MIKGLGTDIVDISRFEKAIDTYGSRFLKKVFTEAEIAFCESKTNQAAHFGGRWAAKESFFKALPVPLQPFSTWKAVQIVAGGREGRPAIEVCCAELKEHLLKWDITSIHCSISHDAGYCTALVVME
jgi:holo-[acyl-carrier protein] synthase